MKFGIFLYLTIIFFFVGCSTEDSFLEPKDDIIDDNENYFYDNIVQNKWTYKQMLYHYYWYKDMPDSTQLDYTQDPFTFFSSLLSPKDRFSWTEINRNFKESSTSTRSSISQCSDSIYYIDDKRIGYVIYNSFEDSPEVRTIFNKLKSRQANELILDLRLNGGGLVSTCNLIASYIAPIEALGKPFQIQRHNDKICYTKLSKDNPEGLDTVYLQNSYWYIERTLNLKRLFVLISDKTASASEALVYGLKPYMEVITIGQQSVGKNVGSYTVADNSYKYQIQPITFRYYNALMDSVPDSGIVPDIKVESISSISKGDTNEPLLKAALQYIENVK